MPQVNAPIRYYLAFRNGRSIEELDRVTAYATFQHGAPLWQILQFTQTRGQALSYRDALAALAKAVERWSDVYGADSFFILPEDLVVFT